MKTERDSMIKESVVEHISPMHPVAQKFARQMDTEMLEFMGRSVVPIVAFDNSAIKEQEEIQTVTGFPFLQWGTGTLLRVNQKKFLITAAHVLDVADEKGYSLGVPAGKDPRDFYWLHGRSLRTPAPYDCAIHEFSNDILESFDTNRFLTLSNIDFSNEIEPGWFYVYGFPSAWTVQSPDRLTLCSEGFGYRTELFDGPTNTFENFKDDWHILLSVSHSSSFLSEDGSPAQLPKVMSGISGCSLWQGYSSKRDMANEWNVNCAKIIAVQTGTYRDESIVKGTRWHGIARVLWVKYPQLRKSMESLLPSSLQYE